MDQPIINRVANSSLVTFDLEKYFHHGQRVEFDIRDWLYEGIILKEKEFREKVRKHDWASFQDKSVALFCSVDAIVPTWAFMLLAIKLEPYAHKVILGNLELLSMSLYYDALERVKWEEYKDAKVVVKGCGDLNVPETAYIDVVTRLRPLAKSIMYGEPCSTVPLYKRPKA